MTTSTSTCSARINPNALLPRLLQACLQQWKAWQQARRLARADELTWKLALQDARMMADLSRAMDARAAKQ